MTEDVNDLALALEKAAAYIEHNCLVNAFWTGVRGRIEATRQGIQITLEHGRAPNLRTASHCTPWMGVVRMACRSDLFIRPIDDCFQRLLRNEGNRVREVPFNA